MSNQTQAEKLIRNLVVSQQLRNYRRSEYQRRRTSKLNRLRQAAGDFVAGLRLVAPYTLLCLLAFVCGALWWL